MFKISSVFVYAILIGAGVGCGSEASSDRNTLSVGFDDCMAAAGVSPDDASPEAVEIAADCAALESNGHSVDSTNEAVQRCDAVFVDSFDTCLTEREVVLTGNDGDTLSERDQQSVMFCETQIAEPERQACLAAGS
jgi:hypothetical protein